MGEMSEPLPNSAEVTVTAYADGRDWRVRARERVGAKVEERMEKIIEEESQEEPISAEPRVFDAIGMPLSRSQLVAYAGKDYLGRPTINVGTVEELKPGKVKVLRMLRSSIKNPADASEVRNVWVNVEKVVGIDPFPEDAVMQVDLT